MRTQTELDTLVRELAPVRDAELAGSIDSPDARRLLATMVARPERSVRRRPYIAAAAAAVAVAASVGLVVGGSRGTATASAATALKKAASTARKQAPLVAQPGQFVYTKTQYTALSTMQAQLSERLRRAERALLRGKKSTAALMYGALIPWSRESWIGPTGGRMRQVPGRPTFVTDRDRELWIADGRPSFIGPTSADWTPLRAAQPLDLPADPDTLYAQLKRETTNYGNRQYPEMFILVGDALRETNASPDQRAALYAVAARIPGVDLVGEVTDAAGRRGIAVAKDDDVNHTRSTLVFDPQTSVLLAEEESTLDGNSLGYPVGTRIDVATYLQTTVVDSLGARP